MFTGEKPPSPPTHENDAVITAMIQTLEGLYAAGRSGHEKDEEGEMNTDQAWETLAALAKEDPALKERMLKDPRLLDLAGKFLENEPLTERATGKGEKITDEDKQQALVGLLYSLSSES